LKGFTSKQSIVLTVCILEYFPLISYKKEYFLSANDMSVTYCY